MQCCTILRACMKGCLLKMEWNATLKTILTILRIFADQITCQWQFYWSNLSCRMQIACLNAHLDLSSNIVQHREHVWCPPWCGPRGGTVEEYFHFLTLPGLGCLARGILGPRPIPHISHARGWADNSAHGDTARADDALTAATTPVTPQLLGPVHSDANTRHWLRCGAWTRRSWGAPHVPVSVWVSSVPPPPLSTLSWSRQFGAHLKFYDICYSAPYLPICTPIKLSFGDVGVNLSCCCVRVTARWPVLLLPHKLWTV